VNERWSVYLPEPARGEAAADLLKNWRGDGIILRTDNPETAAAAAECGCPVISLSMSNLPGVPSVQSDARTEAEMAFAHLRERGFRNLAFCGISESVSTRSQLSRFTECAAEAGLEVHSLLNPLHLRQPKDWAIGRKRLIKWLLKLPKPIGIFAGSDLLGQELLNVCRQTKIRVPDEVAVLGVDDDPIRCGLSDPSLSSVAPDARYIGNLAADLLARMMRGETVHGGPRMVAPLGVVARGSTDALAVRDPDVAKAVEYIRSHACEPISVKSLLDVIPLSRRALESRFIKILGRTPHEQILLCRIERTKQLLHDTDLPIKAIANLVGTATPEYLSVVFRRLVKVSPSEYRQAHKTTTARTEGTKRTIKLTAGRATEMRRRSTATTSEPG